MFACGWALLLASLSLPARAAHLEQLQLHTEDFYPYNFLKQDQPTGFSIELLQLIFKRIDQPLPEIRFLPWKRAYALTLREANSVLFTTARTAERERDFHWVCPLRTTVTMIYGLRGSAPKLESLQQLDQYHVAAIKGYAAAQRLSLLHLGDKLHRVNSREQMLELLKLGRVQLIAMLANLHAEQQLSELLEPVIPLMHSELCFAFNLEVEPGLIKEFEELMDAVMASPEYQRLYQKYFG